MSRAKAYLTAATVLIAIFGGLYARTTAIPPDKLDAVILSDPGGVFRQAKTEYIDGRMEGWWFHPLNGFPRALRDAYIAKYPDEPIPSLDTMYRRVEAAVKKEVRLR